MCVYKSIQAFEEHIKSYSAFGQFVLDAPN